MTEKKEVIDAEVVTAEEAVEEKIEAVKAENNTSASSKKGTGLLWFFWLLSTAILAVAVANLYLGSPWFSWQYANSGQPMNSEQSANSEQSVDVQKLVDQAVASKLTQVLAKKEEPSAAPKQVNIPEQMVQKFSALEQSQSQFMAQVTNLDKKLAETEANIKAVQTATQQAEAGFAQVMPVVEDAVRLATLQHKPRVAALLLQSAATTLHAKQDPQYLVREQQLTQAAKDLLQMPVVDVVTLSAKIDTLARKVDALVLPGENATQENTSMAQNTESWSELADNVWQDIQSLVKVTKDSTNGLARMVSPEAKSLAYTMMKLYLQRLQLAVLSRQQQQFVDAGSAAKQWAHTVFDGTHPATRKFVSSLEELATRTVAIPALPSSLQVVQRMLTDG